jgi:glucose/mannose-6-phosphate isomerase
MAHPLDTHDFHSMITESPKQFATGFAIAKDIHVEGSFTGLCVSGMGGSALPVDILRILLADIAKRYDTKVPALYQNRNYGLPQGIPENTLYILSSYSGNTEETLETLSEVIKLGLPAIGMSAGGELERVCKEAGIPHIKLPIPSEAFQPRMGTGFFIAALLEVLINHHLIPDVRSEVLHDADLVLSHIGEIEKEGEEFAKKIAGKTPVIYAPDQLRGLAMVWKIKFNENAKTPAFWNYFPELNHNEMVGYTLPQGAFFVIMLRDRDDHPRNQKRFALMAELLREKGIEVEILDTKGESVFNRVLMSIALGDFTSYFLALAYGQDPTPVDMVEEFKRRLTV